MSGQGFSTTLIHRGEGAAPAMPLTTPIYETSTFVFENADAVRQYNQGTGGHYLYSRYENPTVVAVEQKLAAADGAEQAVTFSSGMAATSTIFLALLGPGDEVVCGAAIYGGTFHLLEDLLSKFGIVPRFITVDEMREPERAISDRTRVFWFESPNNPHLRCVDIKRIADACRARSVISVIDNTFASPINQRPLAMGIDLAMQSATKYLNGHSDVTAGVVCGSRARVRPVEMARRKLGGILDPQPAYALNRSLKTLEIRIQRHNANAMAVASALEGHPALERVYYPGLASHPDHRIAKCQMSGFGGMVCIDVKGGESAACRAFDRLNVIKRAASLGGTESLCSLPILTSQWGHTDEQLAAAGISKGMMRLSIGLEDPQDLIEDLRQALA
jgi:cystathionine beta-lyase/cystathionine gamma-synthase